MQPYIDLKRKLASGWNTWNVRSVLSHVWLGPKPDDEAIVTDDEPKGGFAINLALLAASNGKYLKEALPGREDLRLGAHATDGAYTDLTLRWNGIDMRVESARDGADLVLLITPAPSKAVPSMLVVEAGILWNRAGCVQRMTDTLVAHNGDDTISVYATVPPVERANLPTQAAYLAFPLTDDIGLSTGRRRTLSEIKAAIITRRAEQHRRRTFFGKQGDVYDAVQTAVAWNTIYDPDGDRVISPSSRLQSLAEGGWALSGQDAFYAALLAAVDSKELAYANIIEIMRQFIWERDAGGNIPPVRFRLGFVPSVSTAFGFVTRDRSAPPVGSFAVLDLLQRFGDEWVAEAVFDDLLAWNRWWADRRDNGGLLAWGSQPYDSVIGNRRETEGVNDLAGAKQESGIENSPVYDDVLFDKKKSVLEFGDAGLTALYIWDCDCLGEIARTIGRKKEAAELRARADRYRGHYNRFWSEEDGLYLNRRLDTGQLDRRISPANFYALLGRIPSHDQAARIVSGHLANPTEFWGDWCLPSIARNDPAFHDNAPDRGRIDARLNFLVYLALRHYNLGTIGEDLAIRSEALLLREWRSHRHVHRSYSSKTGEGCDYAEGDPFDLVGGLLGLISLLEHGAG
ncbi:MAG: hypothetical protein P4L33_06840 [Capsulimonadaceae bacterium]|nr:hypothetical protein [Capsulimonadaceae bacterium]